MEAVRVWTSVHELVDRAWIGMEGEDHVDMSGEQFYWPIRSALQQDLLSGHRQCAIGIAVGNLPENPCAGRALYY